MRSGLDPNAILGKLQDHVLSGTPLKASQIASARIVLDKTIPSISSVVPQSNQDVTVIAQLTSSELNALLIELATEPELPSDGARINGGDADSNVIDQSLHSTTNQTKQLSTDSEPVLPKGAKKEKLKPKRDKSVLPEDSVSPTAKVVSGELVDPEGDDSEEGAYLDLEGYKDDLPW